MGTEAHSRPHHGRGSIVTGHPGRPVRENHCRLLHRAEAARDTGHTGWNCPGLPLTSQAPGPAPAKAELSGDVEKSPPASPILPGTSTQVDCGAKWKGKWWAVASPGSQDLWHVFSSMYCCCFLPKAFYWEWTFMELATVPPAVQNGLKPVKRKQNKGVLHKCRITCCYLSTCCFGVSSIMKALLLVNHIILLSVITTFLKQFSESVI